MESFCFAQETKAVFIGIRYHKTSQKQDVKNQSTKRSHRSLAQPKSDSGFEQKTRIVPSREISGSSQNRFFSYNQRKKQSRAQKDKFGTYATSFWKVCVFLSVKSTKFFGKFVRKASKQLHTIQNHEDHVSKKSNAVFLNIRYRKTSQTQDVKSQSTKPSIRKLAQAKANTAVEQK